MRFLDNVSHKYLIRGSLIVVGIVVCIVIFFLITQTLERMAEAITNESKENIVEDIQGYEGSLLTSEEIEDLKKKDLGLLSVPEARDHILEHSEMFETVDEVDLFIKHAAYVVCDVDGEIREGTGVIMAYPNSDSGEWHVYTNAHITGTDPKKVRMCRVSILRSAEADVYDVNAVDTYEATVIYIADGYPEVDFAVLRLLEFGSFPKLPFWRCSLDENHIGDKVVLIGYPNGLTITSGVIIGLDSFGSYRGEVVETTAKAYPGHSGGLGFNLTNDCSIGLVTWSIDDETFFGLIQSWDTFELQRTN